MRNSILGGILGVLIGAVILAACGSSGGGSANATLDELTSQVQQLSQELSALKARYDAHEGDGSAHHPAAGRLALNYCIATVGTYPSRNLTAPLMAGDPEAELSDSPFLGSVALFPGNFVPRGWVLCDGQLLSVSQNDALFSLIGTIYGGDGRTTFAVPDLRDRAIVGAGGALSVGSAAD